MKISREEAIKVLLETPDISSIAEEIKEMRNQLDLILSIIVIPQQLAADVIGIHRDTISNRARRGKVEILQKDGSSLNFVTLKQTGELKSRRSAKWRKR